MDLIYSSINFIPHSILALTQFYPSINFSPQFILLQIKCIPCLLICYKHGMKLVLKRILSRIPFYIINYICYYYYYDYNSYYSYYYYDD